MASRGNHRKSLGVPRMRPGGSDTTTQGGKPCTTLKLWIIRFVSGGIFVEGYKQVSDQDATTLVNWRSSLIAKRIDSKTVETHSGSVYKLKGGIDEDEAEEAGIPREIIEEFECGFPETWEELIQEHLQGLESARRRQSIDTAGDEQSAKADANVLGNDETMDMGETTEDEDRLREAKQRRSIQKGRKSMMHRVKPATPIEEEEEEEQTPARGRTSVRRSKASETPVNRKDEKKTPAGRGRGTERRSRRDEEEEEVTEKPLRARSGMTPRSVANGEKKTPKRGEEKEEEEEKPARAATAARAARTPRGAANAEKKTPKRVEEQEEEEVFATPDEAPRQVKNTTRTVAIPQQRSGQQPSCSQRRASLDAIPREIMERAIPLTQWVIKFVRGGTPTSIFPHFQFKCLGYRPENTENEWSTSNIQKVVPPYIMFTSTSIYRLDGPLDVDVATDMGFPPTFITDFLMGFPDDWEERLETFFNKTFGPPPQPRIVEVFSDGGTADEEKVELRTEAKKVETKKVEAKKDYDTPRNKEGQKLRAHGLKFRFPDEQPAESRKRKEPTPSSASSHSSSSGEESESDEEEMLRREAMKVEKEMRREERKAQKEAELKAKAKEAKKKRFEVTVNRTPDGVAVSRSGRTLRTPLATWAGENITYDVHGKAVEMTGVTTTTKLTIGKTNHDQTELLAAHYGFDSPLMAATQKERAIAPPTADRPKTPVPRKSKADARGYSDEETDKRIYFDQYMDMLASQAEATPAFNLKKGKRRLRVVESSDSEAEAEERRKEEKRRKKEERRRLRESEEEESSDDGWRRKKKSNSKKKVTVKKEKQVERAPIKKRQSKKKEESEEEEEEGSDLEIEHDDDAVTFVPSEDGSNAGGNGYSDDDLIVSEEETEKKSKKKQPAKRARVWKKEELLRLRLAIQAADPSTTADGWEVVAKSVGGERTAEECKKAARERLKLKVEEPREELDEEDEGASERAWSGAESGEASEDEEKKNRRKGKMDGNGMTGITAKKGTVQYAVEMENKKRDMMMGGSSQDDFFKGSKGRMSGVENMPSVAVFDPNDSLLSVFDDDDVHQQPKARTTKTAMAAAVATPRLSELSYEDSPGGSARRSSSKFIPSPVINQNDLTRYVHHLSRTKNVSMLSRSMMDQSRMLPPKLPRGRNAARAAQEIDKVENSLRPRGRARGDMDSLDEDEENDDNVLPAGF